MNTAYRLKVIAKTGSEFSDLENGPSINDAGQIAFVGRRDGKEDIFVSNGSSTSNITNARSGINFNSSIQINNRGEIIAQFIAAPGTSTLRTWQVGSNESSLIATAGLTTLNPNLGPTFPGATIPNPFDPLNPFIEIPPAGGPTLISPFDLDIIFANSSSISDTGDIVFAGFEKGTDVTQKIFKPTDLPGNRRIYLNTSYLGRPAVRPVVSDEGEVVLRDGRSIVLYDSSLAKQTVITSPSQGFGFLGLSSGISDDGKVIAFQGELGQSAAKSLNLTPGKGIFLAIRTSNGQKFKRVAGISGNGYLDPGESWNDLNQDQVIDIGEDVGFFDDFSEDSRVGVSYKENRLSGDLDITISYLASGINTSKEIVVSKLSLSQEIFQAPDRNPETKDISHNKVLAYGDSLDDLRGFVTNISVYDPINNTGDLAFWVETSDQGKAIISAKSGQIGVSSQWLAVKDNDETMNFEIQLGKPAEESRTFEWFILNSTATNGEDFLGINYRFPQTVTIPKGASSAKISIPILADRSKGKAPNDETYEIFSKDTAYRNWQVGQDIDYDPQSSNQPLAAYGDLQYRVNQVFDTNEKDGFYAAGLTSDEKFYLVLNDSESQAQSGEKAILAKDREVLLEKIDKDLGGDSKSLAPYQEADRALTSLLNSNKRWSVAEGKIYDLNKPPVLAVRGSETEIRLDGNILDDPFGLDWIIADFNRRGVGINQFENNRSSVLDWLNRASNPEQEASSTGDALFKYKPSITGHSLGGGLSQRFAYAYNGELGEVVTFNAPGIDKESVNSDVQVGVVLQK
jgi:hypothetical protein